jgi:hypothetical protein
MMLGQAWVLDLMKSGLVPGAIKAGMEAGFTVFGLEPDFMQASLRSGCASADMEARSARVGLITGFQKLKSTDSLLVP